MISFEYDPGLTALWNEFSREKIIEFQENSEYRTPMNEIPIPRSELPKPQPENISEILTKDFPEIGLTLDYRGKISTNNSTLELPMGARHGFVQNDILVLLLDRSGRGGFSNSDVDIPESRNIVGIGPDCTLEWIIDKSARNAFSNLWRQDETMIAEGYKTWYEFEPTTGAVENISDHYYGRLS
jgi:hypothetical protein